jgi:hypothetical protein
VPLALGHVDSESLNEAAAQARGEILVADSLERCSGGLPGEAMAIRFPYSTPSPKRSGYEVFRCRLPKR